MRHIAFRVDSSTKMGTGHLMRCLTLADLLKQEAVITFISRDLQGNLNHLVREKGYCLLQLPNVERNEELQGYEQWLTVTGKVDAEQTKTLLGETIFDCMIIDHYAIDETWERILRPYAKKIMVIDDLANRKHNCDILLDQNYYCDMNNRYNRLVSPKCKLLLGPQYALLRQEFYDARNKMRVRDGVIKNILVFFGGSDLTNETLKALQALKELNREDIIVNAVVGASNKNKKIIEQFCNQNINMHYVCQINNMAELMNQADLAIGAGGTTTWERCFLGLPAIVIAIAENQIKISEDCAELGIIKYIGEFDSLDNKQLSSSIMKMIQNIKYTKTMTKKASRLVVGLGVNKVISDILE